jgi:zinc protease
VDGGSKGAFVHLDVPKEHFADALRLAAEILRDPAFPAEEFEPYRQAWLQAIEASRSDPDAIAANVLGRHLYDWPPEDPRYVFTPDELIARVKNVRLEDAKRFYEEFYGASTTRVALVGDVDPHAVSPLLRSLLDSWTSPRPYARIVSPYRAVVPMRRSLETPDKAGASFQAAMQVNVTNTDPDYAALALGVFMTGGSESSRLWMRLRERDGVSYNVDSTLATDAVSRNGMFGVFATFAPDKASKVEAAVREELTRILDEGFAAEELAKAKEALVRRWRVYLAQDDNVANYLLYQLQDGRTFRHDADIENQVAALTPAHVHAAIKEHIALDRLSIVKAGNFSGPQTVARARVDTNGTRVGAHSRVTTEHVKGRTGSQSSEPMGTPSRTR